VEPRALAAADDATELTVDHVDELGRTSDHRGAAVDDGLAAVLTAEVPVLKDDTVHLDLPVVGVGKRDILDVTLEESLIVATKSKLTAHHASGVASKPEREDLLVNKTLVDKVVPDRGSVTDRDGVESKTKDTVKLAESESHAALLHNLSEVLTLDSKIRKTDNIIADNAADVTAAVLDLEGSAIGLVGGALLRVIATVKLARDLSALGRRNPEIAGASIEDNLEILWGGTDGDGTIELSLGVVAERNVVVVTNHGVEANRSTLLSKLGTLLKRRVLNLNRDVDNCCCNCNNGAKSNEITHLHYF